MTQPDMTELRELRDRVIGLTADKEHLLRLNGDLHRQLKASELDRERVTAHRNRLLDEKNRVWGNVLRPDSLPTITDPDPEC